MPDSLIPIPDWPRNLGPPAASASLRSSPADFQVFEELGFEADGEGEHTLLYIEKQRLNTTDVVRELSRLSGVAQRDIGFCGMKDRHALTRQWFSVGLAGAAEPRWQELDSEQLRVMEVSWHRRKLRRGAHRRNRFQIVLRDLQGDVASLEERLQTLANAGAPNYFGEQRFGRGGANLERAANWLLQGGRAPRRSQRSIQLSAARSYLFNLLLAQRVHQDSWRAPATGDTCLLAGSHSFFVAGDDEEEIRQRAQEGDIHLGLPLWGAGQLNAAEWLPESGLPLAEALEQEGLKLQYRPARLLPDDFCWQFCDDGSLQLSFALDRGCFATALVRELVQYNDKSGERSEFSSEQR